MTAVEGRRGVGWGGSMQRDGGGLTGKYAAVDESLAPLKQGLWLRNSANLI